MTVVECTHDRCEVPGNNFCRQFHADFHNCENYLAALSAARSPDSPAPSPDSPVELDVVRPAWSGNALTPHTATTVWATGRPPLIGLIGLPDAGKTSFLATLYLRLRHERLADRDFTGSMTLSGWAKVSRRMHWADGRPPGYPPRTGSQHREPGFLHIALRDAADKVIDLLIADTKGEWYQHWLTDAQEKRAEGARWTVQHADALLFFIDLAALADPTKRHLTRSQTERLIDRAADQNPYQRVIVIHAKQDQASREATPLVDQLTRRLEARFRTPPVFHTIAAPEQRADAGQDVLEAVAQALLISIQTPAVAPAVPAHDAQLATFIGTFR